jgi:phospholipid N-methyltransferase
LKEKEIEKIDLIISGLPFKSLPLEIFYFIAKEFLPKYTNKNSIFIQFSYFKNFSKMLEDYFLEVEKKSCFLNLPKAYVFRCKSFIPKREC